MSRKKHTASKPARAAAAQAPPAGSRPARRLMLLLAVSAIVPLGLLVLLREMEVMLGQGSFVYCYSQFHGARLLRIWPPLLLAVPAVGAMWLLATGRRTSRAVGLGALAMVWAGMVLWTWWAPPAPVAQHAFNLSSVSHEGAFVIEAEQIPSLPSYLQHFEQRLQRTPHEMRGTRILSNPPGMTIFAWSVRQAFPPRPDPPGRLERHLIDKHHVLPRDAPGVAGALRVAIALMIVWAAAGVFAYLLGRQFLSPLGAVAFTAVVIFNPSTVHFAPGKDPAQLLAICAMLWAWFAGWRTDRVGLAVLAGGVLMIGMTFGLIHLWVALAALAATMWHVWATGDPLRRLLLRQVGGAGCGAVAVAALALVAYGWNIPATLLAVSRRFAEVQDTIEVSRLIWFFIGLPIFLLFLSPGFWAFLGLSLRRWRRPSLGRRMAICTSAAMLLTYIVGVTYELPRLWVVFVPMMMLAIAVQLPVLRSPDTRRAWRPLALVIVLQVAFTALHWTLLDARESEHRIATQRYFD